ncbi:subtilisin-like protease SBT1.2 [Panicum miliaceum]|uniref:Subtilisin-like protease SBT1.2 n=1 Tax=Panicum miliaceum TaxID=4540 RepID=A0A3L6Q0U6_PANMI|nr:subtilisin-like protease SBT1.2 [Panicum miliaceum]
MPVAGIMAALRTAKGERSPVPDHGRRPACAGTPDWHRKGAITTAYQPANVSASTFYPLVYAGASGKPYAELCGNGSLDGLDVRGKIVLCELGSEPGRRIPGAVVKSAGGAGMILLNTFPHGYTTIAEAHVLPASHVDYAAASAIKSYVSSMANATATDPLPGYDPRHVTGSVDRRLLLPWA